MKQLTIGNSFTLEGKGLHTGVNICLKAHPAPANHGIRIRRTDMEGTPEIEAVADNVMETVRGTVLRIADSQVSTIEHAMAAFYAAGIDNCLFEVNGPEFPILDGSARYFVENIQKVGVVELDAEKDYITITELTECVIATGSNITAYPDDSLKLDVMIGFNSPVLKQQSAKLDKLEDFNKEISAARTFVFVREIEPLLNMNLIKGGDLKNAIVIYDKMMSQEALDDLTDKLNQKKINASDLGYLSGALNFENEPARHKLLDVLGDLALTGKPVKGRIVANYPGHTINTEFAKLLRKKYL
jgi:UDP-3-O-[3-hydroxymyristoyl] N-acetylglucosamine deacetylase / 3-hydroxyacyl-[acyl-carrier-protein] dehydratase